MRLTTIALFALGFMVVVIWLPFAWVTFQPARRPNLSVTFLGYSTNAAGTRLGKFAISNLGNFSVTQLAPFLMIKTPSGWQSVPGGSFGFEVQTPTGWTGRSRAFLAGSQVLRPGASEVVAFATPTNQSLWKITFRVVPDAGAVLEIKRKASYALLRIGLRPRYNVLQHEFDSDVIPDKP